MMVTSFGPMPKHSATKNNVAVAHNSTARSTSRASAWWLLCRRLNMGKLTRPTMVTSCSGNHAVFCAIIYWDQWARAIPALYVYALAITFGFLSPVVAAVLEALGKPQIIFRLAAG